MQRCIDGVKAEVLWLISFAGPRFLRRAIKVDKMKLYVWSNYNDEVSDVKRNNIACPFSNREIILLLQGNSRW